MKLTAYIINIVILALEARALMIVLPQRKRLMLVFYTQLSNLAAVISSALFILFRQKEFVTVTRYTAVCMLLMTVFVTTCVLIPMGGNARKLLLSGNGLYHHTLCPALSLVSYIFFEDHASVYAVFLPVGATFVYGSVMLFLNWRGSVDGPYPFFRVRHQSAKATVLWFLALLAVITAISAAAAAFIR